MNAKCDGRISCALANLANLCEADITDKIIDPFVNPRLDVCTTTTSSQSVPTAAPVPVSAYNDCTVGVSSCEDGFVCCVGPLDLSFGKFTCRPSNDCSVLPTTTSAIPSGPTVSAWNDCVLGSSVCEDGYVCCIGPLDLTVGKFTCRPSSDCSSSSTSSSAVTTISTPTSTTTVAQTTTTPVTSKATSPPPAATVVSAWNTCVKDQSICEDGYVCCIGPLDLAISKYTCRPASDCPSSSSTSSTTVFRTPSTSSTTISKASSSTSSATSSSTASPNGNRCNTVNEEVTAGTDCEIGKTSSKCAGTSGIAHCVPVAYNDGIKGEYIISPCVGGRVCSNYFGYPVCDFPSSVTCTATSQAPVPTSNCPSTNPILADEDCKVGDLATCSGHQIAKCSWKNTDKGVVARYSFTNCPLGTVCTLKSKAGYAVCVESLC